MMNGGFDPLKEAKSQDQQATSFALQAYFINNGGHFRGDKTSLENYGLIDGKGECSLLACLLSDRNEASIKVVRFRGKHKTERQERKEFGRLTFDFLKALNKAVSS